MRAPAVWVVGLLLVSGCPQQLDDPMALEDTGTESGLGLDMPGGGCSLDKYDPNDSRVTASLIDAETSLEATLCAGEDGADIQAIHELLEPGRYEILVERREGDPAYRLKTYALSTATPTPTEEGAVRVFCPRFDLDGGYDDAAPQGGLYENFGVKDDPNRWEPKAMLVQVLDGKGNVRRGWGPLDDSGCTPPVWTPSPSDTDFILQFTLWSHFVRPPLPETFMIVYDCEQMQPCELPMVYAGWETAQGAYVKESEIVKSAEVGQQFREELLVYWATAFAEFRVSMGVDAHIYARVPEWILPQRNTVRVDAKAHVRSLSAQDSGDHEPRRSPDARHRL